MADTDIRIVIDDDDTPAASAKSRGPSIAEVDGQTARANAEAAAAQAARTRMSIGQPLAPFGCRRVGHDQKG